MLNANKIHFAETKPKKVTNTKYVEPLIDGDCSVMNLSKIIFSNHDFAVSISCAPLLESVSAPNQPRE